MWRGQTLNGLPSIALRLAAGALILGFGVSRMPAQEPATPPQAQTPATATHAQGPADAGKDGKEKDEEEDRNPFAPEPAPALPAGMSGSDANDPRAKLTPGVYDAGETAVAIKHVLLI